jgi:hypothetical protein
VEGSHSLLDVMQPLRELARVTGLRYIAVVFANRRALERFHDPRDKDSQLVSFIGSLQDLFHRYSYTARYSLRRHIQIIGPDQRKIK